MTNLTVTQAAARLDVDTSTVRRWCESGKLLAEKFGHVWSIDPEVLAKFKQPKKGPPFKRAAEAAEGVE